MNYEEEKKRHISFCGSYCHTCDWFTGKIRKTFRSALDMVQEYGFKRLLEGQAERDNLVKGLEVLSQATICSGCKAEVAESPKQDRCQIRQCASGKGFELCSQCSDFPCDILKSNPGVLKFGCIENLKEIQDKGLDRWINRLWAEFAKEEK
ncbi:MAG: DUF3795 domain-containing protein [candidate division Zixibacteria bacterium]|nr:DUF3795 domain-containing protein [candidate division Zixibacteria bacterium]